MMNKCIILIMCMLGTIGLSYANNCACKDELTVQAQASGNEKTDMSSFISANINGHYLTVAFLANLGEVTIEIFDDSGLLSDIAFMETPTGYQYYNPNIRQLCRDIHFAERRRVLWRV